MKNHILTAFLLLSCVCKSQKRVVYSDSSKQHGLILYDTIWHISWETAQDFIKRINSHGDTFHLPTVNDMQLIYVEKMPHDTATHKVFTAVAMPYNYTPPKPPPKPFISIGKYLTSETKPLPANEQKELATLKCIEVIVVYIGNTFSQHQEQNCEHGGGRVVANALFVKDF